MLGDPFWGNIFHRERSQADILREILRNVPLFQDLGWRDMGKLQAIVHRRSYATEEMIVSEGEPGSGMYVIFSGCVEIRQGSKEGTGELLATFSTGDFFGEQALLDESPRTASAVAVEPTEAVGFLRTDLLELTRRYPRLGLKIVMRLSQMISLRLRHTNNLLKDVHANRIELNRVGSEVTGAMPDTSPTGLPS